MRYRNAWTVLYVIAGTKKEFNDFVLKNVGSDRYRDTNFCWVGHCDVFKGQVNPNGICIGTWKDRPDILDILQSLLVTCRDQPKFDRALELGIMVTKYKQSKTADSSVMFGSPNGA